MVDSESVSSGVPYSDSFKVKNRVCLIRLTECSTKVITHSALEFISNPFVLIKSKKLISNMREFIKV